jgi:hypothetical protein
MSSGRASLSAQGNYPDAVQGDISEFSWEFQSHFINDINIAWKMAKYA